MSLSIFPVVPADVISTVEFNQTGDLLATGDKGGRVVIFQRESEVRLPRLQSKFPLPQQFMLKTARNLLSLFVFPSFPLV